ncbi:transmembrane protein 91 [Myxocyprinus asiaticus]|uniref:transmembrane protein 91 n=1 Tax=Myxocyprinus asiaticus TaxID=70543 RepID=UPI002221B72C|nr:transmembrane protein 91 [Myxocyprinus asiaticus]
MESLDELEHPLLGDSPKNTSVTGTSDGGGLFKGILARNEEDKNLAPQEWRNYCSSTDFQQQQLLDPCSLPSSLESLYPPTTIWAAADSLGIRSKEYLETTFVDIGPGSPLQRKLLAEMRDVHSVSYSMEDGDDLLPDFEESSSDDFSDTDSESNFPIMIPQDYLGLAFFSMLCCFWPLGFAAFYLSQKTNKASAQGDFQGAIAASRQALWLSVLSIIFGIITYICAIAALISYLSGKPL